MKTHIFCDSHGLAFTRIPNTEIHHFPSFTMHRVGRDKLDAINFKNFIIKKDDVAVFVFGEIDVRGHIGRQRDIKHRDLHEIIQTLSENYIYTIVLNREVHDILCIVYSVTPPTEPGKPGEGPGSPETYYGTLEDRILITKLLNSALAARSAKFNIPFLDVYDDYSDEKGEIRKELSDHGHGAHIDIAAYGPIQLKLNKILLSNGRKD